MAKTYIALDLETTGLDSMRDAIIEVGALRFDGEEVLESFSTFVNPGRKIPPFITELTGITDDHVVGAPGIRHVASGLRNFVGRDPVVGHNIGFDLAFLRRHGVLTSNAAIDTFELAGILVPHASRYSLENLVQELAIDLPPQTHRALDDARMAHALYVKLLDRATQLPADTLRELVRLGKFINWGPSNFFRDAQYIRRRHGFTGGIGTQLANRRGGDAAGPLFVQEEICRPLEPRRELRPIDDEALAALLERDGPLAGAFSEYEYRPQQIDMLKAIVHAFNAGEHLMVEAGTGTGKSLAYLLPAVEWAVQNRQRVVISTNTINLQEQLAQKDLPELAEALYEFRYQVLKGRSHYLCRRQFETLRRRGPATEDEMRVLAKTILWLPNTLDGDGDALFLPTSGERGVWHTISAASEGCDPERCPFHQGDGCFFYRARAKAESAHLLVVNHALLLADIAAQNRVLPEHDLLIVDEAHHLERAATEAMKFSENWPMVNRVFNDLLRRRGSYPGLLELLLEMADAMPRKVAVVLQDAVVRLQDAAERTERHLDVLFSDLEMFLSENSAGSSRYSIRLRLTEMLRDEPGWGDVVNSWKQLAPSFSLLVEGLEQLVGGLEDLSAVAEPELEEIAAQLVGITRRLAEIHGELTALIAEPSENAIYWLESYGRYPFTVNAVPLHVSELVREQIFKKKRSVVLTSATLRIAGDFSYMQERLGAQSAETLAVGSPFDYRSAAMLYLPLDIPEPGRPGYQEAVEKSLFELFKATEGRAMALFTSYSQLKATAEALTKPLAKENITVYAQGAGSSRAQLLHNFRKGDRAVLLGTRSFWEGVDVSGEALSCLVIVKLPFDVPSDPVVASRAEQYEDPFNEYMVPEAILRFLQGFGRLIRTATDQGIAVVLDRRLLTKRYGQNFLDSLPDPLIRRGKLAELPGVAKRWLAGETMSMGGALDPEFDDGWSDEASGEPDWFWGA